jgi:hypothetical protein
MELHRRQTTKQFSRRLSTCNDHDTATFLESASEKNADEKIRKTLRRYCGCLSSAIEYVHAKCIKHFDIKPQNVLTKRLGELQFFNGYLLNSKSYRMLAKELQTIRRMLELNQKSRPLARDLKQTFESNRCCDEGKEDFETISTQLQMAAQFGHVTVVKLLLEGFDFRATNSSRHRDLGLDLLAAAKNGHGTVADVATKDGDGLLRYPWRCRAGTKPWSG